MTQGDEDTPMVSVVIPAYNAAEYIGETLESVLAQSFSDFEVIIVNNGSTDQTLDVLGEFTDERVQVISQEGTGGPAGPRNRAIREARGEYIAFLDADDCWHGEKLERQLTFFRDHSECALVATQFVRIDENSVIISDDVLPVAIPEPNPGDWFERLCQGSFFANSGVMVRRSVITDLGGLDEHPWKTGTEDYDLWLRIARKFPVGICKGEMLRYRVHHGGYSNRIADMDRGCFLVTAEHLLKADAGWPDDLSAEQKKMLFPHFGSWAVSLCLSDLESEEESVHVQQFYEWSRRLHCLRRAKGLVNTWKVLPRWLVRFCRESGRKRRLVRVRWLVSSALGL